MTTTYPGTNHTEPQEDCPACLSMVMHGAPTWRVPKDHDIAILTARLESCETAAKEHARVHADKKARLLERLKENIEGMHDPESNHDNADRALLEFIDDAEVTAAFEAIEKWYT